MDTQKIHNDLVKSMHEFEMRVKTLRDINEKRNE